jgi:hypothetical protein
LNILQFFHRRLREHLPIAPTRNISRRRHFPILRCRISRFSSLRPSPWLHTLILALTRLIFTRCVVAATVWLFYRSTSSLQLCSAVYKFQLPAKTKSINNKVANFESNGQLSATDPRFDPELGELARKIKASVTALLPSLFEALRSFSTLKEMRAHVVSLIPALRSQDLARDVPLWFRHDISHVFFP